MRRIHHLSIWLVLGVSLQVSAQSPSALVPPAINQARFQAEPEPLPVPPIGNVAPIPQPAPLVLDEVLTSVDRSYPLLLATIQQQAVAAGDQLSSRGAYDLRMSADNFTGAPGFYETNRASLKLEQATLAGGKMFSGYRIGRGSFEPWYLERQTNDGGEFKVGFEQSLLQGRAIDKYRLNLRKADLALIAAEPKIDKQRIYFIEYASMSYWKWVAAGQAQAISRDLVELARRRVDGIETRIRTGVLKEIELVDNRRLIVSREAKLIVANRKFQQAGIELSLFLRDEMGHPILPPAERLPQFPEPQRPQVENLTADETLALSMRPEPRYLRIEHEKLSAELAMAQNQTLPRFDVVMTAGQDVGAPTSPKRDKSRFELESGLVFEVPIQRRYAVGQIQSFRADLVRVRAEIQYAEDRVVADVRSAVAGLQTAYDEFLRAVESVQLAQQMQDAELKNFELGNSNILFVNLREQATADARFLVIDALEQYYDALAQYRAALGIDSGGMFRP